ncbi:MAG: phosphate ABC transporter permease subunit PstC [Bryobacteraceae bacterium]
MIQRRTQTGDIVARWVVTIFAASILVVTFLLVYQLWSASALSRHKSGFGFLASTQWNPVTEEFGALPFAYGTMVTSILALLISVPSGLGAAIFLAELAPARLSNALTFLVELLAAIPSVIYGLLALFTVVPLMRMYIEPFLKSAFGALPFFKGPAYGVGFLTAGIVLSIMTIPFIISVSRESLLAVPREQREASLALGATRWETTWRVVVPYAKLGIFGSIFLSLARALGETMAVTMVIGNDPKISASLLSPGYSIAAVIAGEFSEATTPVYQAALVELGLVLFFLTVIINGVARLLILATSRKGSRR